MLNTSKTKQDTISDAHALSFTLTCHPLIPFSDFNLRADWFTPYYRPY